MTDKFAPPFKHPRDLNVPRKKLSDHEERLAKQQSDYVTTKCKERDLAVPAGEIVVSMPTVAVIATAPLLAPVAVPVLVASITKLLCDMQYDTPNCKEYGM